MDIDAEGGSKFSAGAFSLIRFIISEILGHSKIMTSLIYSHTDQERKRKAVKLLEG
jgi:integrase